MDPQMFEDAKARSKRLGFPTFSAYVVQLIRADLSSGGSGMLVEETPATVGGLASLSLQWTCVGVLVDVVW